MKFFNIVIVVLLVLVVMLSVFIGSTDARRKNKKGKAGVCKYERKGEEGPCDTTSNTKVITLPLKKGDPATCAPSKTVNKPCNDNSSTKKKKIKGCKYERKMAVWSLCDPVTNERTKDMRLKPGSPPECPVTQTKVKKCGNKKANRKANKDA